MLSIDDISKYIKDVPNFPKEGVLFKDITPLLENSKAFQSLIQHFVESMNDLSVTKIVAVESRGFILGAAIVQHMNLPLVLARKPGKLPRETSSYSYDLEYGQDTIEIHKSALTAEDKVVIVDDVLATGGTAHAVQQICINLGAEVLGHRFLMEIEDLKGWEKLSGSVHSFMKC